MTTKIKHRYSSEKNNLSKYRKSHSPVRHAKKRRDMRREQKGRRESFCMHFIKAACRKSHGSERDNRDTKSTNMVIGYWTQAAASIKEEVIKVNNKELKRMERKMMYMMSKERKLSSVPMEPLHLNQSMTFLN